METEKDTFTLIYKPGVRKGKFIITKPSGEVIEDEVDFEFRVVFSDRASLSVSSGDYKR